MGSDAERTVTTTDYHTAGEPFRIVTAGVPDIPGATVLDRREHARRDPEVDAVRRLLCHEPRGHADMYGCFLVPPDDGGAHLGVLFWHTEGYSTACGHGTIALGTWAVESGRVPAVPEGETEVRVDVPSGRVVARVRCRAGAVASVAFRNVPSYVLARAVPVPTSLGRVEVDVAYGGAIYACVPAGALGLAVRPDRYADLIAAGREVKRALHGTPAARHPTDERLSGIYGTILYEDLGDLPEGPHQRNVTVFADGEVDRSPCGSGTSARVALLAEEGRLGPGRVLRHDSIVDTTFTARVVERVAGSGAVVSEVEGAAFRTGEHRFVLDPRDPVGTGFVIR
jgi:proline racemase